MSCPVCKGDKTVSVEVVSDDNDKFQNSTFLMVAMGGYLDEAPYCVICANCGIVYMPKK
jgi:uncharacterized Zn finger protein